MIFPDPCSRLRIWSREMASAVPSRVSLLIAILRLNLELTYGIPPRVPRRRPFIYFKPPCTIGSVPSLSGHAIAYRWRSLPRVRRHRASKPQGSSERVLRWQIIMDQLICASLSHTHYWYEVGMLKIPAICYVNIFVDLHIQRAVLATEETTVTQRVTHRPIKCQSRSWSQRRTKIDGSHHDDNPVLKPTEIQIATKSLPGPTTREYRKVIGVKTMSSGTN